MIRAVIFDLDRTLLDRDASFADFARSQHARFLSRLGGIAESTYVDCLVALDAQGAVWKDVVYQRLVADLGITAITWGELFADFDARIAEHYVPFPGLHESLDELSRFYQLGLISNGRGEFQQRTLNALGISDRFQVVLISEIEGLRKPDAAIFHRALQRLSCEPAEAVYVGDHPEADVRAARSAGLRGIWKRNDAFAAPEADGIIDSLRELPSLLLRLDHKP